MNGQHTARRQAAASASSGEQNHRFFVRGHVYRCVIVLPPHVIDALAFAVYVALDGLGLPKNRTITGGISRH